MKYHATTIFVLLMFATAGCNRQSGPAAHDEKQPFISEVSVSSSVATDLSSPFSITLDNEGVFADGWAWTFTVNSDCSASLEIRTFPNPQKRTLILTREQVSGLRSTLESEEFFELADEYGVIVPSGSTQTITVQSEDVKKTVKLHHLMNWVRSDTKKLEEPARAIRVWRHVRQWFVDDDAVDLGRYDQIVLDAVTER